MNDVETARDVQPWIHHIAALPESDEEREVGALDERVEVLRQRDGRGGRTADEPEAGARSHALGVCPSSDQIERMADRAARFRISVLILGDTGVGKEVLARRIHFRSPRAEQPLVCIDCAGLCPSLAESELFGHERGAFTGAATSKPGLFEIADGGTVFLDEVGELPLAVQAKLLRALDTRTFQRVGSTQRRIIDVRFLAATNRDLESEVKQGRFRADLLFRLDGIRLEIPPLRERSPEVPGLARAFLSEASCREGIATPGLSDPAIAVLQAYHWPGNVRELRNVIERALVLCDADQIEPAHLVLDGSIRSAGRSSRNWRSENLERGFTQMPPRGSTAWDDDTQRELIASALKSCAGNQTRAAKLLGISRRTLLSRLDSFGITRPRKVGGVETAVGRSRRRALSEDDAERL